MVDPILQQVITAIQPLPEEELSAFAERWEPVAYKRKTMMIASGDVERYAYIVTEGLQRVFFMDDNGREATLVFTYSPSLGGVADSFLLQMPSRFYYETLTTSKFLRLSFQDLQELSERFPLIRQWTLRATALALRGVMERMVELQLFSAEEKFRTLLRRSPHVLQLIPHKYLASYLGIDPTTFSKLLGSTRI